MLHNRFRPGGTVEPITNKAMRKLNHEHLFILPLKEGHGFDLDSVQQGLMELAVPYQRDARVAGASKFNFWKLWNFALEGITSFSTAPLRVATYLGVATAVLAFGYGLWIVLKALAWGDPVAGWPTMMAVILFLGGTQLVALGLIGEYLGRLYEEAKQRPLYLVDAWRPPTGVSSWQVHPGQGGSHAQGAAPARGQGA